MAGRTISYINQTLCVNLDDGRELQGVFLAFDKHMNMVLADVVESRTLSNKSSATRALGLVLLRGEHVVSIRVEGKAKQGPKVSSATGDGVVSKSKAVIV